MGMGDCLRCIKYLLFVFNLIFCLIGLAILAIGVWAYVAPTEGAPAVVNSIRHVGIFFLIIGSIITVLGFLGCCGAIFENRCLLVLFFILLLLIFLVLVASGIVTLMMKTQVVSFGQAYFSDAVYKQNVTESKNFTDTIQSAYHCCGAELGEKDYTKQGYEIPESCSPAPGKTYVSCTDLFGEHIGQWGVRIAIAVFVTAVVALLGMIFSMMLCCAITDMA